MACILYVKLYIKCVVETKPLCKAVDSEPVFAMNFVFVLSIISGAADTFSLPHRI
jgi:hypothetical protein